MCASLPRLAAILAVIELFASAPSAQETTGTLEGRVLDADGLPIAGVIVVVAGPALQGTRQVNTTSQGFFVFLALPVGEYSAKLSHAAYEERVLNSGRIRLGQTTSLGEVRLKGLVRRQEEVEVSARAPLVDPASTFVGADLVAQDFALLPIERDYRSVTTLLPQANQSFLGDAVNFAGSTGLENRYFIDGIDVTDPNRNITGTSLPYNFVQEVQVRTGGYEAEYRSSLGGVVNAVTYSGGNQMHGQFFGFFVNNRFTAEPRQAALEPNKGDFARFDVGFGVGGPILKDRLWYYLAYAPGFEREDVEIPGWGFFQDRTTTHSYAGKLTWRASQRHALTFTAIGDPTQRRGVGVLSSGMFTPPIAFANPDPYLEQIRTGGISFMLDTQHLLRDNLLFRALLSRAMPTESNAADTGRGRTELLFVDSETGRWSGGVPGDMHSRSEVTTAALTGTLLTGQHLLKGGIEYKYNAWRFDIGSHYLQRYSDVYYFELAVAMQGQVGNRILSTFLQDSWRLTEHLRLNVGLRWDGQYIISSQGKVAQTILDQWQPRIGFAWQPGTAGTHKLSGSFGRFYQELPSYPLYFYYNENPQNRFEFITYDHDPRVDPTGGQTLSCCEMQPKIRGMEGQHFDELTLGYDRRVGKDGKLGMKGVYRALRQGLEDGWDPVSGRFEFNNPGRGGLSAFPRVKRNYSALEVSYQRNGERSTVIASYVLSRTYGNYPGLFNSDFGWDTPNANGSYDMPETLINGEGLLPNDRPHVLKLAGHYRLGGGLTVGAVGLWESGTPLNEFGGAEAGAPYWTFLRQRGTAGRMPAIWDLNLRVGYEPPFATRGRWQPRLSVDVLHVASRRTPVDYDQVHYFNVDAEGNQIDPNPTYGSPTRYQPPMAVRLGLEVSF